VRNHENNNTYRRLSRAGIGFADAGRRDFRFTDLKTGSQGREGGYG
jgi:hypothetical protein